MQIGLKVGVSLLEKNRCTGTMMYIIAGRLKRVPVIVCHWMQSLHCCNYRKYFPFTAIDLFVSPSSNTHTHTHLFVFSVTAFQQCATTSRPCGLHRAWQSYSTAVINRPLLFPVFPNLDRTFQSPCCESGSPWFWSDFICILGRFADQTAAQLT